MNLKDISDAEFEAEKERRYEIKLSRSRAARLIRDNTAMQGFGTKPYTMTLSMADNVVSFICATLGTDVQALDKAILDHLNSLKPVPQKSSAIGTNEA